MKKLYVIISTGTMLGMDAKGYEQICDTLEEAQAWVDERVADDIKRMTDDACPYRHKGGAKYHICETISTHHHGIGKNSQWPMSYEHRDGLINRISRDSNLHPRDVWEQMREDKAFKHFRQA